MRAFVAKFQIHSSNTFRDMNYYPVTDRRTDGQADGQKVMHMSPPCICKGGLKNGPKVLHSGQKTDLVWPH